MFNLIRKELFGQRFFKLLTKYQEAISYNDITKVGNYRKEFYENYFNKYSKSIKDIAILEIIEKQIFQFVYYQEKLNIYPILTEIRKCKFDLRNKPYIIELVELISKWYYQLKKIEIDKLLVDLIDFINQSIMAFDRKNHIEFLREIDKAFNIIKNCQDWFIDNKNYNNFIEGFEKYRKDFYKTYNIEEPKDILELLKEA